MTVSVAYYRQCMSDVTVRRANLVDLPSVRAVAIGSGLFDSDGWTGVELAVRACLSGEAVGLVWVGERSGRVLGVGYVAPEPFADSMWNLYLLAVDAGARGSGIGSALVRQVEGEARQHGVRTLVIETSGVETFAASRSFYESLGYAREARIRDFYGDGDDKVVYWKSVASAPCAPVTAGGPVAFVGADRDGRVSIWNHAAETLVGYARSEILGRAVAVLVPESFRSDHERGFAAAMATGPRNRDAVPFHLPVRCADGTERLFAARFVLLDDPGGRPCGAVVLLSPAVPDAVAWSPVAS